MKYYLIGCGGIGGWLGLALGKMLSDKDELVLIDGDSFEEKNLDRQMCTKGDIGRNKARALKNFLKAGARCQIETVEAYIGTDDLFRFDAKSMVLTGVDNHRARLRVLNLCDQCEVSVINAANGYEDAEAYFYDFPWSGTALDPRVYYPELQDDEEGDPLSPSCTGEILESTPQLAMANMMAAGLAMNLLWFWTTIAPKLQEEESRELCPVHYTSTASRVKTRTIKDLRTV